HVDRGRIPTRRGGHRIVHRDRRGDHRDAAQDREQSHRPIRDRAFGGRPASEGTAAGHRGEPRPLSVTTAHGTAGAYAYFDSSACLPSCARAKPRPTATHPTRTGQPYPRNRMSAVFVT